MLHSPGAQLHFLHSPPPLGPLPSACRPSLRFCFFAFFLCISAAVCFLTLLRQSKGRTWKANLKAELFSPLPLLQQTSVPLLLPCISSKAFFFLNLFYSFATACRGKRSQSATGALRRFSQFCCLNAEAFYFLFLFPLVENSRLIIMIICPLPSTSILDSLLCSQSLGLSLETVVLWGRRRMELN